VATDETEKKRGSVRHGVFYEGHVTVIRSSAFVRETDIVKAVRKSFVRQFKS
jgi:hypothetical protein